jgi:hypothetical protein
MNQLKKLGFTGPVIDHAVDDNEGVIVHTFGVTWVWFLFKSRTNQFTPRLFQFVCARAAALGEGSVYLECDAPAEAGLLAALKDSVLEQAIVARVPPNYTSYGTVVYEVIINYTSLLKAQDA